MNQSRLFKIIVFLSLSSLFLFGVMYFAYSDIRSKNERISTIEQELLFQNNQYDYLLSMRKLVENLEPKISKIDNSIISKNGDVNFIENLEKLARDHNLKIEIDSLTLASDPKEASSPVTTLKIRAKVEGSWKDSYLFISEIESISFKIKINKLSLVGTEQTLSSSGKPSALNNKWQTTLDINVLKYK